MDWESQTMALLLMMYAAFSNKPDDWEEYRARQQHEKEVQDNCPNIEWEQDMGARIPFCKIDNEFCNMQCVRRNTTSAFEC